MKRSDFGGSAQAGWLPKPGGQDSIASPRAAELGPEHTGAERELHASCEVDLAGFWLATHF